MFAKLNREEKKERIFVSRYRRVRGRVRISRHAQDAMKKETAVKPADPELKVVLDSWNEIGRKLTAMAEDFPEDKYDFKPTPAQRASQSNCCMLRVQCITSPIL
jgi:hypothetical protein